MDEREDCDDDVVDIKVEIIIYFEHEYQGDADLNQIANEIKHKIYPQRHLLCLKFSRMKSQKEIPDSQEAHQQSQHREQITDEKDEVTREHQSEIVWNLLRS